MPADSAVQIKFTYFFLLLFLQTIGTKPVAHIDQFTPDMLGSAELAEEVNLNGSGKLIKVSEWQKMNSFLTLANSFNNSTYIITFKLVVKRP